MARTSSPALVLWSDTTPEPAELDIVETDGKLVFYNVWDSGRGLGAFESQSATSGMVVDRLADGWTRYSCNDIGRDPQYDRLVFRVRLGS